MKTKLLIAIFLLGCLCSGIASAQPSDTLFVSTSQVVHLRFASDLKYLSLGDRVLVARIVDGSKDFVAVRAREAFSHCTTISCLETSGAMHTFLVAYREHPDRLEVDTRTGAQMGTDLTAQYGTGPIPGVGAGDHHPKDSSFFLSSHSSADGLPSATFTLEGLARRPQELYHIGVRDYGISLLCENIFVMTEDRALTQDIRPLRILLLNLMPTKIETETQLLRLLSNTPLQVERLAYGLGTVTPGNEGRMVFAFDKLALIRGQVMRVYFYEKGGVRNMVLTLSGKDLMKAKAL